MKVFEKASPENTAPALDLALDRAIAMGCDLVLSTSGGDSAFKALKAARDKGFSGRVVVVTHVYGMKGPGENTMTEADRAKLEAEGAVLVTAAHALSGVERAMSGKFKGVYPTEVIAHALRMFCQGVKVCVEVSAMALDAGKIPYGQPLVVMGGTGRGLDTACVLTPGYSADIFSTRIHELLCKPY